VTAPRYSILGLMAGIAFLALILAAVAVPSPLATGLVFTLTVCALFAAVLGIVLRRGEHRASWIGAAVMGWGYLGLVYFPWFGVVMSHELLGAKLARWLEPRVVRTVSVPTMKVPGGPRPAPTLRKVAPDPTDLFAVCHAGVAVLLALAGGVIGRSFYRKNHEPLEH
jgi:hypothetical protein